MAARGIPASGVAIDQAGPTGIAELYVRFAPEARRLAYLLTGDHASAEDIAQDAFIRIASRLSALRSPNAFPTYLRRTVVNLVRSRARTDVRERARLERHARLDGITEAGGATVSLPDSDSALWNLLHQLPERQRAALVLRFGLDLSERQTAASLRCRPGTVKSLVSRGLATLREAIDE